MTMTNGTTIAKAKQPRARAKQSKPEAEVSTAPPAEPFAPAPPITAAPQPPDTFRIRLCFQVAESWYSVVPLDPDPAVMRVAFRMTGLFPDGQTYDVGLDAQGRPHCECKGFLYGKGQLCRHLRMIGKARLIQLPPTPPLKEDANGKGAPPAA